MTGVEARYALAQAIGAVVPEPWTVQPGPVAGSLPAIVVQTVSTRPGTFCAEVLVVTVTVLENVVGGLTAYDSVETMAATLLPTITATDGVAYQSTDKGPMIAPGGVEAYGATINLELYVT